MHNIPLIPSLNSSTPQPNCCIKCGLYRDQLANVLHTVAIINELPGVACENCGLTMDHWKESAGFTIHHVYYGKASQGKTFTGVRTFLQALQIHGVDHYQNVEKLQILCKGCHLVLHAKGDSTDGGTMSSWKSLHKQVVDLFGGQCRECGERSVKSSSLLHLHHVAWNGAKARKEAENYIPEGEWELGQNINEYKLLLRQVEEQGGQLGELSKSLQCLCAGCHLYEHMSRHIKLILNFPGNTDYLAKVRKCMSVLKGKTIVMK